MCVGPTGTICAAVTAKTPLGTNIQHVVTYRPGDKAPRNHGPVAISNPDFTEFTDKEGQPLPHHTGFRKMDDGATTTKHVILGVCQGRDGSIYTLALSPYTLIRIPPEQLR
jgi:hypothetical protein